MSVSVNRFFAGLLFIIAAGSYAASVDPDLPRYEPRTVKVDPSAQYVAGDGAIVVVGYNDMRDLLEPLAERFQNTHPGVRLRLDLPGTRFAPAPLARDESAFAPMGAEFTPSQLAEYRSSVGSDPLEFRVAHASLDPKALSGPLAVFVHRDNPIASLTLAELSRIYTGDAKRWGDLGLRGDWAQRPIVACGVERGTPLALSFQQNAMHGQAIGEAMIGFPQSADVVRMVSTSAESIGYAAAMRADEGVRVVPLALHTGDRPVALTEEAIVSGRYPLDRFLLIYARAPLSPIAREFLRLVLSHEGQEVIARSPQHYLPLSASEAVRERAKLE